MAEYQRSPDPGAVATGGPEADVDADGIGIAAEAEEDGAAPRRRGRRKGYGVAFWAAVAWLAIVLFCAVFATIIPGLQHPNQIDISRKLNPPFSAANLLGADGLGRDILARIVHGARVSVTIAFAAVGIGMTAGGLLGMSVGYFRGRLERVTMSVIDVILAFPGLVLLLALVAYRGQDLSTIAVVIGLLSIPVYTRVARANTLSVSQREFVLAAKAMGARHLRILFREIFPNVILPVLAFALIAMGVVIVLEGALAFLGLSVQAPQATWGSMINEGRRHFRDNAPHVALIPSTVMFLTVLSLNFVGDTLRSRFDVREANL